MVYNAHRLSFRALEGPDKTFDPRTINEEEYEVPLRADETDPNYDWSFGESEASNFISLKFHFFLIQMILIMVTWRVLQQTQVTSSKAVGVSVILSAF